uniref:Uncharacterized protein n=1 Tax=Panagrolaimus sp. ES5 TaxID=591445 RepID=A0AC34FCB5_9BILA
MLDNFEDDGPVETVDYNIAVEEDDEIDPAEDMDKEDAEVEPVCIVVDGIAVVDDVDAVVVAVEDNVEDVAVAVVDAVFDVDGEMESLEKLVQTATSNLADKHRYQYLHALQNNRKTLLDIT